MQADPAPAREGKKAEKRHSMFLDVSSAREGKKEEKRYSMFLCDENKSPSEMRERSNTFSASKLYFEKKTKNKKQLVEDIEVTQSEESLSSSGSSRNNLSKSVSKNSLLKIFKIK